MLVYVLICLTGGVISDLYVFADADKDMAEQEYAEWVEEQDSDGDVLLFQCNTTPSAMSGLPAFGQITEESYGEG